MNATTLMHAQQHHNHWQTKAWRRSLDIPQQDGCEGHLRSVRWELQSRFRDAELSNAAQTFIDPKSLAIGSIDFLDFFELALHSEGPTGSSPRYIFSYILGFEGHIIV